MKSGYLYFRRRGAEMNGGLKTHNDQGDAKQVCETLIPCHFVHTMPGELPVPNVQEELSAEENPLWTSALKETVRVVSACRVLLVEDNPINLFMMKTLLNKFQCRVDTAETGSEALERLAAAEYKVVLLDIQLPDFDGVEVCRRIRCGEEGVKNPSVPVVALTACAMNGDREKFLHAGMNDYLSKPINLMTLIETLKKHCQK
jgi:CheY-like chemotaxis protein